MDDVAALEMSLADAVADGGALSARAIELKARVVLT
jgi:hypothetical protein